MGVASNIILLKQNIANSPQPRIVSVPISNKLNIVFHFAPGER